MKSVTIDDVMAWEPCNGYTRERVTELFAGRESVTALDILDMDIPHYDRVDAVLRSTLIDSKTLRALACDFAEHVLPLFEAEYPDDDRPRRLVEATRQWAAGLISYDEMEIGMANALDAMRGIGQYPYIKSTTAANVIQAAIRAATGMGIGGLGTAPIAALYATRASNIGGDGVERRWQVKHIRETLAG